MLDGRPSKDWSQLSPEVKEAAMTLGYRQLSWDNDEEVPAEDLKWKELPQKQRRAAEILGYTPTTWDQRHQIALVPLCGLLSAYSEYFYP